MGKPRSATYFRDYARKHRDRLLPKSREAQKKRLADGKCKFCSQPRMPNSNQLCRKHWFTEVANEHFGRATVELGRQLEALLERQNYRCPYTGVELVPGVNCWLDHIQSRCRNPELAKSIENVEWVDVAVNKAKGHMTPEEFIALCRLVAENRYGQFGRNQSGNPGFEACGDSPLGGSVKQEPSVMNNE